MPTRARTSKNDRHASGATAPNACIRATTNHDRFRSGDRSPRSPRTANALGYPSGGVFLFAFAKEFHTRARISASRTVSHTHFLVRSIQRERPNIEVRSRVVAVADVRLRRESAAPRCSVRVAARNACAHELPVVRSRQCEASIVRFLRYGFPAHPVRAAVPWRMPETMRGCFSMTRARGRAAIEIRWLMPSGSIPVRRSFWTA